MIIKSVSIYLYAISEEATLIDHVMRSKLQADPPSKDEAGRTLSLPSRLRARRNVLPKIAGSVLPPARPGFMPPATSPADGLSPSIGVPSEGTGVLYTSTTPA